MEYHLINLDKSFGGITGEEPTHDNWTLTPYLGGLVKERWNGAAWVEGATPKEIAQNNLSTVPETVTAVKLFGQLLIQGINEASLIAKIDFLVENSIITPLQGDLAKVAIAKATIFERNHPFVTLIGSAFEIDIDQLFVNADNLAI